MVSPESREYLRQLRETPSFGADGFNLEELRLCMAGRREPADPAVQCLRVALGSIPAEWVLAPGADPDVRLLYLHGGGYVSGSGAYYLANRPKTTDFLIETETEMKNYWKLINRRALFGSTTPARKE